MRGRFLIMVSSAEGAEKFTTHSGSLSAAMIEANRLATEEDGLVVDVYDASPVANGKHLYSTRPTAP